MRGGVGRTRRGHHRAGTRPAMTVPTGCDRAEAAACSVGPVGMVAALAERVQKRGVLFRGSDDTPSISAPVKYVVQIENG